MLQKSEICQRFFFGMGVQWVLTLLQFFSPLVENLEPKSTLGSEGGGAWFENVTRVGCAVLALKALCGALEVVNKKHQSLVAVKTDVVCSATFWVARKGPDSLVQAALLLMSCILESNCEVASQVADMVVEVSPPVSGRTHPLGIEMPAVYFGWRPLPSDDRRLITVPALLAERYVYSSTVWSPSLPTSSLSPSLSPSSILCTQDGDSGSLSLQCLHVLETLLRADGTTCDLMIQYILAPPPPSGDDQGNQTQAALESMRYVRHFKAHHPIMIYFDLARFMEMFACLSTTCFFRLCIFPPPVDLFHPFPAVFCIYQAPHSPHLPYIPHAPPPPSRFAPPLLFSLPLPVFSILIFFTILPGSRPLGAILFNALLEGSNRIFTGADSNFSEIVVRQDVTVMERCANVLSLLFINGGQLSSELCTVINTSHTSPQGKTSQPCFLCFITFPLHLSSRLPRSFILLFHILWGRSCLQSYSPPSSYSRYLRVNLHYNQQLPNSCP